MDTLRESSFGLYARIVTNGRLFPHPEERPDFVLPDAYLPNGTATPVNNVLSEKPDAPASAAIMKALPEMTLVTWYGPHDPANPQNWSQTKKAWAAFVVMYYTFAVYVGSAIVAYGTHDMAAYFGVSEIVATLTLTLFVVGYGIGPLFLAPLSEIGAIGRNPPYVLSLIVFCVLQIPTALSTNFAGMAVLRFLAGFAGSPPLATGGASMTDLYSEQKAGYAIGLFGVAVGVAPAIAPLITGFATVSLGWRWSFWILLIMAGFGLLLLFFGLPETSADNILYRRAARLRKLTGNPNLRAECEILDAEKTFGEIVYEALVRPMIMTIAEPIILAVNLYIGLTYAILYSFFESYPLVYANGAGGGYGWSMGMAGLPFLALTIGAMVSFVIYCIWARKVWEPQYVAAKGRLVPEAYLPLSLYGAFCYPICLFWFAWSANRTHWMSPTIASALFGLADCWSFMPYLNYLTVAYPKYAASALASNDFVRSMMGAAMPIVARPLFNNLGVDWGNSVLGFASVAFVPLPFVLMWTGEWLRGKSPRATHVRRKDIELVEGEAQA